MNKRNLLYLITVFIAIVIYSTGVIASDDTGNGNNGFGVSDTPHTVSASEFRDILNHNPNVFLLDVRTPAEYNYVHIEGAKLIPVEIKTNFDPTFTDESQTLANRLNELPKDKNTIILVYCFSGHRSDLACPMIVQEGYTKVYSLENGLPTWVSAGYPVVTDLTKLRAHYPPNV